MERITRASLEAQLPALLAQTQSLDSGALVVFAGTVRQHNDGRQVTSIEYSAYTPLAEKVLAQIEGDTLRRFDVLECAVRHRVGPLQMGEISVLIVTRSVHRAEAYEANRFAIEAIKHEVPIWKYETYADGSSAYVRGCALHGAHDATGSQQAVSA